MRWPSLSSLAALLLLVLAACGGAPSKAAPGGEPPLVLERTIPLPGVGGRIDHMALDVAGRRLFVAELGAGSVEAVDLTNGHSLARRGGFAEPQGLAYLPALDELVVAGGGDGQVRFLRAGDLSEVGRLSLGDDADDVRLEPAGGRIVVGYGAGGLAVIDPPSRQVVRDVRLEVHPEGFSLDPRSGRAFVNLPNARKIAVVDLASGRRLADWGTGARLFNFPMALDGAGRRVAVVFRAPARLVVLDAATGGEVAAAAACGDSDDVFYDDARSRLYVSCGAGRVDVFQATAGRLVTAGSVATRAGARTSLYAPQLDRLFVAARAAGGEPAAILVYRPASPAPR
jgi:DNA-binding beta-propeller fold protein YncE